jgi:hypothetical protein
MPMTAMVVVTFPHIDDAQRALFDQHMDEQDWIKVPKLENAWAGNFPNAQDDISEQLTQVAVDVVTAAARQAKVSRFDAAVQVSHRFPAIFSGP